MILLYRGPRNVDELACIIANKTAGGKTRSINPTKPSDDEMKKYAPIKATRGECMPPEANDHIETEFTEYTSDINKAIEFGRRLVHQVYQGRTITNSVVVCIEIDENYVTAFDNDFLEKGYLIRSDTPFNRCQIYGS
ncbi:MAG: hypothetical protein IKX42_00700 [Fibrobacter sp.]|nr:hypothetical protein [Fibrobacter sp.]